MNVNKRELERNNHFWLALTQLIEKARIEGVKKGNGFKTIYEFESEKKSPR